MGWKHNELARDLADHLRGGARLVWEDMQLGPAGSPRPDVYTLAPSFARFTPIAYECKISVSDFRSDVTSGKWQSYLKFAGGVIFAAPAGLISKSDVPATCGLILRGEKSWRTVRKPTLAPVDNLPRDAWIKLLIDGVQRLRTPIQPRRADVFRAQEIVRQKLGERLARLFSEVGSAEYMLEEEKRRLEACAASIRAQREAAAKNARSEEAALTPIKAELAEALGLPPRAGVYAIQQAARRQADRLRADRHFEAAQRALDAAESAIKHHRLQLSSLATPVAQEAAE